ncbi:hypothetical protein QCB45_09135 [Thiomicrorhabdus sp. ZW0627]|uniref:hypothetical protein n=1 Tax=Thiomicrorhabdus sp. ZW0627 TaxID=3039774 RepID=UPI00243733F7|nr:hypothetical protein [Thiomicrorhabdus sp. ZW0627]MDG6774494.1 hypothetical protein [Thiomicrorhabdus sp. ZW0627]
MGIDRDNDGVRDDIQRYIYFNYSSDLNVQAALTQLAKQYQVNLVVANDRLAVYHEAVKFNRRMECLFFVAGRNAIDLSAQLKAEVLNTSLRTQKHLRFNKNLGGQIIISKPISEWPNSCNFQIK